ncbi:hypothetical protein H4V97_000666 [Flavobacterium sp. CG_23.5]|uniref:hypothetical protein n=1 Tax=unclassified Flavobacterium TaxID=196869 RepID=UPI0018CB62B4|nr:MULTISPECIES: hypothetical protein [unclassified Flavobacterium]MBG6111559.1 hypothetical protein [Flavobacterium sp. CG_9.10]MBP2282348.1 hypothetical protein [Flavobacterium sp. CG_23.5]
MYKIKKLILLLLMLCYSQVSFSQIDKPKKDSTQVYKSIQTYSKKNKFTRFVHKLVFRPVNIKVEKKKVVKKKYQAFEGRIIRKINIITLDPFGYSEIDSTRRPKNWAEREGNRIHIKTNRLAILNLLLIKRNHPLDSLLLKESERLIRTQRYVNRVSITPQLIKNNSDSVDVSVRVLDSWSMIPRGSISSSRVTFEVNERNFLGSGHQFENKIRNRFSDGKTAYGLVYSIPNIKNTFIKTAVSYFVDLDNYYGKSINIERPFYSPLAKWAGGIYVDQQFRKDTLQDSNLIYAKQNFKYNSQDLWIGHAFKLFKGNTESDRTTNLILSGRFLNVKYIESPTIVYDPIDFYAGEKFYLSGIGITSRKFVEDKYIFKNGVIEDVPIGKTFGITGGYQYKNEIGRYYLGGQASFGNFYKWGFLSANFELGSFFDKSKTNQTAFSFQANYFTNLIDMGRWKLRQFIKPQFILGINRVNSIGDQLTINDRDGINGFTSAQYGTEKVMLTLQTQAYSPWDLWGFRLNPYFNYSIAMLGNAEKGLTNSKAYSKISVGFIINNDYLVFSSFQISLSYYPSIPNIGENVFKTNSFETTDFGFQDFELAKPRTVIFK